MVPGKIFFRENILSGVVHQNNKNTHRPWEFWEFWELKNANEKVRLCFLNGGYRMKSQRPNGDQNFMFKTPSINLSRLRMTSFFQ
jgi:hypothetical protein